MHLHFSMVASAVIALHWRGSQAKSGVKHLGCLVPFADKASAFELHDAVAHLSFPAQPPMLGSDERGDEGYSASTDVHAVHAVGSSSVEALCGAFVLSMTLVGVWSMQSGRMLGGMGFQSSTKGRVVGLALLSTFFRGVDLSIIWPVIFDQSSSMGEGAGFSGLLGSLFLTSSAAGVVVFKLLVKGRMSYRFANLVFLFTLVVGSFMYLCGSLVRDPTWARWLVILSRCVAGLTDGVLLMLQDIMTTRIVPQEELVGVFMAWALSDMLGVVCGLMLSSVIMNHIVHAIPTEFQFAVVPIVMCSLHFCVLLFTAFALPGAAEISTAEGQVVSERGALHGAIQSQTRSTGDRTSRKFLAVGTLAVVYFLTLFADNSLELGTTLLLELEYGWDLMTVGGVTSCCLACFVPYYLLSEGPLNSLDDTAKLLMSCAILFCSSCLLHPLSSRDLTGSTGILAAPVVIASAALASPSVNIAKGLARGLAFDCSPDNAEHISGMLLALDTVSTALSGALVRHLIATGGRGAFAFLQILTSILTCLVCWPMSATWRKALESSTSQPSKEDTP